MSLSFELPYHGMCVSHMIILHSDQLTDSLNLNDVGLEEMPNAIILDGVRFLYGGVVDGVGQYQKEVK